MKAPIWTEDEDRVLYWSVRRGISRRFIARPLGRTVGAIRAREGRLGIDRPRSFFTWNGGIDGKPIEIAIPAIKAPVVVRPEPTFSFRPPVLREILARTAEDYGLDVADLIGRAGCNAFLEERQDFMWRARAVRLPNGKHRYSLTQIGAFIGRHHASVLHGVRDHEARLLAQHMRVAA